MSGGGGSNQTTTQVNYSPQEAARREQLFQIASDIYGRTAGNVTNQPYPGAQVAPFSANTIAGQQAALQTAQGPATQLAQTGAAATQFGLGPVLDVNTNPYLQSAISAAIRPATQAFTDPGGILSQIRGGAIQAGGYGGTRQGIAEGVATGRLADTIYGTAAQMASTGYGQGLDAFGRTLALLPQTTELQYGPAGVQQAIGAQQENLAQQQLNYEAEARKWDLTKDWAAFEPYANLVFGAGSSPGSISTSPQPTRNPAMGALGGAAAGAAAGSVFPGYGTAIGAGIGALLGYFGSR